MMQPSTAVNEATVESGARAESARLIRAMVRRTLRPKTPLKTLQSFTRDLRKHLRLDELWRLP
jgi:hypothetical protein